MSNDLTIALIVRDEVINPAGGIKIFIEKHINFCTKMVIVDTGSTDGTYELLLELAGLDDRLSIYKTEFNGYAEARNFALQQVKTEWVLTLDADEMIRDIYFEKIYTAMSEADSSLVGYALQFLNISPDGDISNIAGNNPRLFRPENVEYFTPNTNNSYNEFLTLKGTQSIIRFPDGKYILRLELPIFHFVPEAEAQKEKEEMWYSLTKEKMKDTSPNQLLDGKIPSWKKGAENF